MTGWCRLRCVLLQSRYAAIARAWLLVGGAWLIGNNAQAVLLPPEGILLNRIHVQFEWAPVGGAVDITISGVLISVTTTAGQTAEEVVAALVAAINADPTLSVAGINGVANPNELQTDGTIDDLSISDPGLMEEPPQVPALSPWGYAFLANVLLYRLQPGSRARPRFFGNRLSG